MSLQTVIPRRKIKLQLQRQEAQAYTDAWQALAQNHLDSHLSLGLTILSKQACHIMPDKTTSPREPLRPHREKQHVGGAQFQTSWHTVSASRKCRVRPGASWLEARITVRATIKKSSQEWRADRGTKLAQTWPTSQTQQLDCSVWLLKISALFNGPSQHILSASMSHRVLHFHSTADSVVSITAFRFHTHQNARGLMATKKRPL